MACISGGKLINAEPKTGRPVGLSGPESLIRRMPRVTEAALDRMIKNAMKNVCGGFHITIVERLSFNSGPLYAWQLRNRSHKAVASSTQTFFNKRAASLDAGKVALAIGCRIVFPKPNKKVKRVRS